MVASFHFSANSKFLFGPGTHRELPSQLQALIEGGAGPVLWICSPSVRRDPRAQELERALISRGLLLSVQELSGEPSPEAVDRICEAHRARPPVAVVGFGGGSVLDTAKAVSAMLMEQGSVLDFLEGVGQRAPSGRRLPLVAMPTTAGTGSECTKNAVISRPGPEGFKKSLRHERYIPDLAIVDPIWLEGLPREVAVACGLDAFCQLLESYLSTAASPLTDGLALEGLRGFFSAFPALLEDRAGPADRAAISLGAALSGLTLTNAGLGAVHGIAGALGGLSEVPHGRACGLLLAPVMRRATVQLRDRHRDNPDDAVAARALEKIARLEAEAAEPLQPLIDRWTAQAALPGLAAAGLSEDQIPLAARASTNKNSPAPLSEAARVELIRQIL